MPKILRMRSQSTWQEATDRMEFGLSPERPIRVGTGTQRPNLTTIYDVHFEFEMGVVTEGSVKRVYSDGYQRNFGLGDVWFHGMWEPHG